MVGTAPLVENSLKEEDDQRCHDHRRHQGKPHVKVQRIEERPRAAGVQLGKDHDGQCGPIRRAGERDAKVFTAGARSDGRYSDVTRCARRGLAGEGVNHVSKLIIAQAHPLVVCALYQPEAVSYFTAARPRRGQRQSLTAVLGEEWMGGGDTAFWAPNA